MDAVTALQVAGLVLAPLGLALGVWAVWRADQRAVRDEDDEATPGGRRDRPGPDV